MRIEVYPSGVEGELQALLAQPGWSRERVASIIGVSAATVTRWCSGAGQPRPSAEGRLRALFADVALPDAPLGPALSVRDAVSAALHDAREALHRHARFSSRHEALDEMCKLLFAQVVFARDEGRGLTEFVEGASEPAMRLVDVVREAFRTHLPIGLSCEMSATDFELRLRATENELALELAGALSRLAPELVVEHGYHDLFNEVFGSFLADSFTDEKQLGQYLTPPEVVLMMVDTAFSTMAAEELDRLTDPRQCQDFGFILDPSCGVASFLTMASRRLTADRPNDELLRALASHVLIGIDKSERMLRLALTSFALLGAEAVNLHLANSLSRQGPQLLAEIEGRAGLILTNPPFGAEFSGDAIARYELGRVAAKVDSELLFIERYLDWLRDGGALLAIVPDSVLTNRGLYQELRALIRSRAEIEAVVSLPAETFSAAGTATKTSVLYLRKTPTGGRRHHNTYVALCTNVGFNVATRSSHRKKVAQTNGQLPAIVEELTGDRPTSIGELVPDLAGAHRWDAVYHASLPAEVQEVVAAPPLGAILISDVADLSMERVDPRRLGTGTFSYIEISDVDGATGLVQAKDVRCEEAPSRARKGVRAGDVLVSTVRPERRAIGVVPPELDAAICSTGFAVLRPRAIDPTVLACLLRTDFVTAQILRNNMGVAYPAVDEGCLAHVLLPVERDALAQLGVVAKRVRNTQAEWYAAQAEFSTELAKAVSALTRR